MIYFTSDTHYHHKNITKGVSGWSDTSRCRDFDTIEKMNEALVNGINETVGEDDVLYHLGDWAFGGKDKRWEFRKQLNVKEIHLILGNHDHHIEANKALIINNDEEKARKLLGYEKVHCDLDDYWVYAQDLFSSVSHYKEVNWNGHIFCLFHYAMRVWNKRHHQRYHLYGHSHNTLPETGDRSMDVGVDSAFELLGEYRPFSVKEIISRLQKRKNNEVDHHGPETN